MEKKNTIAKLLSESQSSARLIQETDTGDMVSSRPTLVALTRKTFNKIYDQLAGVQPTRTQIANVFGVRYQYESKEQPTETYDISLDYKNFGGHYHMDSNLPAPTSTMVAGDYFTLNGYVFQVIKPGDYTGAFSDIFKMAYTGEIRLVADAIEHSTQESDDIQDIRFVMNKWKSTVRSRKLRSQISLELLQDMGGMNMDGDAAIEDLLSVAIAEEVNSDIISKLVTVATKEQIAIPYLHDTTEYFAGRDLVARACRMAAQITLDTTFKPTYILTSTHVGALIQASGLVDDEHRVVGTHMKLVIDAKTPVNYMLVGVKANLEGLDTVSAVYYSPYIEDDDAGTFMITADPHALQPVVGVINRYALSTSPDFRVIDADPSKIYDGEDWVAAANKSQLARMCMVQLKDYTI
ncbi:capsid vertex protein [Aeromonas phage avDM6]|nr:capsid vertex protein [Aeromonas phage avDM6]